MISLLKDTMMLDNATVFFVMGAIVPFIDIIIFAVIAVLLVFVCVQYWGSVLVMSSLRVSRPTNRFDANENESD